MCTTCGCGPEKSPQHHTHSPTHCNEHGQHQPKSAVDSFFTAFALRNETLPKVDVHHQQHAHLAYCLAENGLEKEVVIGIIFDGNGYGPDGTVCGGEFVVGGYPGFIKMGHLRALPLIGGDTAIREQSRTAISYLHSAFGDKLFDLPLPCVRQVEDGDRELFLRMLKDGENVPPSSSCGRLFDAVAALIGLHDGISCEEEAAVKLEALAESSRCGAVYRYRVVMEGGRCVIDFAPMIRSMVDDIAAEREAADIARAFHNTLTAVLGETCRRIRGITGISRVVLFGAVFQNKLLSDGVRALLSEQHFRVHTQQLIPAITDSAASD